jgi:hypothetical protein
VTVAAMSGNDDLPMQSILDGMELLLERERAPNHARFNS